MMRRAWRAFVDRTGWTPPTRAEVTTVLKAAVAASVAWALARLVTNTPDPVLAPLTALICVRVSAHSSVRIAVQRSAAVVLGVVAALAIGDAVGLNWLTVGLVTGAALAVALLVLRLPRQAANQMPVSVLVVLAALATGHGSEAWERALNAALGAAVGAAVSLAFPASRVTDARETFTRLGTALADVLKGMAVGLRKPWSVAQTAEWRRRARVNRDRLVADAKEAAGNGREAAQWNIRDRRHVAELGRYEDALPRVERTAIGVASIARGLDDAAHAGGNDPLPPMMAMAALLDAATHLVQVLVDSVLGKATDADTKLAFEAVRLAREPCAEAASRRARTAPGDAPIVEWMTYAAVLVQVDRMVEDLR